MSGIAYDVSWLGQRPGILSMAEQMAGSSNYQEAEIEKSHFRQFGRTVLCDEEAERVAAVNARLKSVKLSPRAYLKYGDELKKGDTTLKNLSIQLSLNRQAVVLVIGKMEEAGFVRKLGVEEGGRGKEFVWHWVG